jgi:hypothetical protein
LCVHRMHAMPLASCRTLDDLDGVPPATTELGPHRRTRTGAGEGVDSFGSNANRTLGMGAERNTLDKSWNHSSQYGHVLSRSVRHVTLRIHHAVRLGSQRWTRHLRSDLATAIRSGWRMRTPRQEASRGAAGWAATPPRRRGFDSCRRTPPTPPQPSPTRTAAAAPSTPSVCHEKPTTPTEAQAEGGVRLLYGTAALGAR